jgi:hypothetical protein
MENKFNAPFLTAILAVMIFTSCSPKVSVQATPETTIREKLFANDINSRVLRSFYNTYGELPDAKWVKTKGGFAVSFKTNNINHTIHYQMNGVMYSRIRYYFEKQLPPQVRHLVRSNFYDYTITHVTEVYKDDITAFYVKVEDPSTIKTIKIVDEEWEVVEKLAKR